MAGRSGLNRKDTLTIEAKWVKAGNIILSKVSQPQNHKYYTIPFRGAARVVTPLYQLRPYPKSWSRK